jgi:hypothetical protein
MFPLRAIWALLLGFYTMTCRDTTATASFAEPNFYDEEGVVQISADEAGTMAVIGGRLHYTLFELRPAFVDGIVQDKLKPVATIMLKVPGAISVNKRARRVLEPIRRINEVPIWLGQARNRPVH